MSKPHHELKVLQHFNPFEEFNTEEIDKYKSQFDKFDVNGDHVLDFMELKRMMEILGAPQTHVQLKDMIKEIDDDFDGTINFTEFLLIFKKARDGELSCNGGLLALARMTSIDVSQAGVSGAKDFFEAKAKVLTDSNLARRASTASTASSGSSSQGRESPVKSNQSSSTFKNSNNNRTPNSITNNDIISKDKPEVAEDTKDENDEVKAEEEEEEPTPEAE